MIEHENSEFINSWTSFFRDETHAVNSRKKEQLKQEHYLRFYTNRPTLEYVG